MNTSIPPRKFRSLRALLDRWKTGHKSDSSSLLSQPRTEVDGLKISLCDWCRKVDWEAWQKQSIGNSSNSAPAAVRVALLNPTTCEMCEFLSKSLNSSSPREIYHLINMNNEPFLAPLLASVDVSIFGLVPHLYFPGRSIYNTQTHLVFEPGSETTQILRPIMPQIDLVLVRSWLQICLDWHTNRCCASGMDTSNLRVIDCSTRSIVNHSRGAAYITLSYVWGSLDVDDREILSEQPSTDRLSLPLRVPQTIEDAIEVTMALGYQYLWVDKYCIDPNVATFHMQLAQMNLVYHNSALTIIASAGPNSHYGLPGISRLRQGSPQVKMGMRTFFSIPFSITGDLDNSPWSARAWTYQEGILSTRRLVFTERQVYYECQGYYCFEGISASPDILEKLHLPTKQAFQHSLYNRDVEPIRTRTSRLGAFPADRTGSHGPEIKSRIEEYSKRSLTYEGDIINAMLGLFELYRKQFGVLQVWGIPYPRYDLSRPTDSSIFSIRRLAFLHALKWTLKSYSSRRQSFPSWSWTGWHGAVRWQPDINHSTVLEHWCESEYVVADTQFSIKIEKLDGDLIDWVYVEQHQSSARILQCQDHVFAANELSRFIHVTATFSRILSESTNHTERIFHLESDATLGEPRSIRLDLDSHDYSPTADELYALHMPWKSGTWMLVVKNMGTYWERVGLASYDSYRDGLQCDARATSTKILRLQIRLG
jgi:hypothetical protein